MDTGSRFRKWNLCARFSGLTIISHRETRNLMGRYTPVYPQLFVTRTAQLRTQLETGAGDDGKPLTAESKNELIREVQARDKVGDDFKSMGENPLPGLTFDQGTLSFDLGNREVQVKFLGRGNTARDIVAFLPKEKIAVVGDLLVNPLPYTCFGFPVDWVTTLDNVAALQPEIIVPGHGEVMHNLSYLTKVRDLLKSVIGQVNEIFQQIPGGGQSLLERARKKRLT